MKRLHIEQSMDGKSRWADNIMIERWFRSLKAEEIYLNEYDSPGVLRQAIGKYIGTCNTLPALSGRTVPVTGGESR